jgi:SAM-dependent methyltransferase
VTDLYNNWARVYDYFYLDRSQEVSFWAEQASSYGRWLLDLMCGTAEVSLGLARRGYRVVGIDRSLGMLTVAGERLAAAADYPACNLALVQAEACTVPASRAAFDFVLIGGTGSFNHLDDRQAHRMLRGLSRLLRPGGGLGLELVNPHLVAELDVTRSFGPLRSLPPGLLVWRTVTNRFDADNRLLHIQQRTSLQTGDDSSEFQEEFTLWVRSVAEIRRMLAETGFGEIDLWGGHNFEPWDRWSPDLVVVANLSGSARVS